MNFSIEDIQKTTLFSTLKKNEIENLLTQKIANVTQYSSGKIIHFEDDYCDYLEIILSGKISIERIDASGNLLTITELYINDILGGNLLFSRNPSYPMTVIAKEQCAIISISKDTLLEILQTNANFLTTYLELISDNALILGEKIQHYINRPLREKIINYLNQESKKQDTKNIILPVSKKDLAEKLGVQRTSLSRELLKMKNDKLINYIKSEINILY